MSPGSSFPRASLLLCCAIAIPAPRVAAQARTTDIVVSVVAQDSRKPVQGATVVVAGTALRTLTDAAGRARLAGVGAGEQTVEVRSLGYRSMRSTLSLSEGAGEMRFQLVPAPVRLAEVRVQAAPRLTQLGANGFVTRRRGGNGTFITREEIERKQPRYLSDLLRRLPGISLSTPGASGRSRTTMRGATARGCQPQVFVDGTQTSVFNIDDVPPGNVEAMEIYRGAATIPVQYNRGAALCGVVLIWTRER